ncbi:MAG TPA: hypothetical protein VHB74_11820 [Devosia sp.]|nr:hypothetical protein [Devosia sp.]
MDFSTTAIGRYVRILALIALLLGLNDAARLLGVFSGGGSPLVLLGLKAFIYLAIFTLSLLFASVGLWIRASWGAVLLFASTAVELAMFLMGNKDVSMSVIGFGLRVVLLAAVIALFVLNFRIRRAAAAHD